MTRFSANVRLFIAAVSALALGALFVSAPAHAHTHSSFDHPWHHRLADVFMLTLPVVAVVSASTVLIRGSAGQRIVAVAAATLPIYVLVRFVVWVVDLSSA